MNYTTNDIAELLDLTQYTVKRHLKRMNLEDTGFFVQAERNINVLYYPEETFQKLKAKIDSDRATEENNYTTKQLAELLGISSSCVNNIAIRYNIPKKVLIAERARVAYFSKDSLEKFRNILDEMQDKRSKWEQKKAEATAAELEEAETLHPLVTDKRCLNLNWWPDVVPECFKELSA
jgi:predicted transcriptional regulator